LEHDRYETEFEAETARLAAVVTSLDPHTPVPTCPEWTVRDLVTHVGTGHRWVTGIVHGRHQAPPPYVVVEPPAEPDAWVGWLTTGAGGMVEAIRGAGPDEPVWTWQSERRAGFWLRKMLHDGIVHRFDAELAGAGAGDLATDLAVDGVSDLLTSIATLSTPDGPDPVFSGLVGAGETLQFVAVDAGATVGEWFAQRTPAGVRWRPGRAWTSPGIERCSGNGSSRARSDGRQIPWGSDSPRS
jgi:uncharacterized protein (TIGR03083 family)